MRQFRPSWKVGIPARADRVTQEPQTIAPGLLGSPLATFRRRAVAYVLDLALFGVVIGAAFVALSLASIHREDPTLLPRLRDAASNPGRGTDPERRRLTADLLRLVDLRAPESLPTDLAEDVRAGRIDEVVAHWSERDLKIALGSGRTRMSRINGGWTLTVGTDVTLGEFSGFFSWTACFVGWFTLFTRLGRGATPGKRLLRIRVVRLDGRPLRWWDAFGRAGGYSASAATAMLGFLEMIWDPNRQALHDRIARTVVLSRRGAGIDE